MALVMPLASFGGVVPIIPTIVKALVCAKYVFDVIEREPMIKSENNCIEIIQLKEKIEFHNVSFRYPT